MTEVMEPGAINAEELERTSRLLEATRKEEAVAREKASAPDAEEVAAEMRRMAGTPAGFVQLRLKIGVYQWQSDVLSWFEDTLEMCKGSVCTPNGAGKSSVIVAGLALWWITVHPQGKVVITTRDSKQLDNQIWPAIEAHKDKFPEYDFIERMVRNRMGGFIVGFTTDDPGRAEGWHKLNDVTGPLLLIEDEAKSVPDAIDMAFDRCTYNAKLLASSPGLTEGFFWRSHRADQPAPPLGYHHIQIGLSDCPHIPKSRIDNILAEYGEDHWFTRSTLYGEFTDADSETLFIIPKHVLRQVRENPPRYVPGGQRASCDFGAGRAENVYTLKQGNRISQECWKDADPMRAVYQFIKFFVRDGLNPSEIYGDAGGMGIAILARFTELGWPINGVNNESEPIDSLKYDSLGAEMWHNGAIKLAGMGIILPDDDVVYEQLGARRAAPGRKGLLGYESKKDMAKRGVASPDRADGIVMVLATDTELANVLFDETGLAKLEGLARSSGRVETGQLVLSGPGLSYEAKPGGWLCVYERPIIGMSYICVVNPFRHDEPLGSHSVIVVRAPYYEEKLLKEQPARVAAKVRMNPFRLDAGPLAAMVGKVSGWYGKCLVVPIVNDRGDVIEKLEQEGIHLYSREEFEVFSHGRTQRFIYGWETDDFTRSMWIGQLAEWIREDRIKVEDVGVVMQLYQLNGKNAGRMRDAEALGVALQLMSHATTYTKPRVTLRGQTEVTTARSMIS